MYLGGIDLNIQSLPVAAIGIGIGIDYGYYVLSRIVEELVAGEGFDVAIRRMFETTGKTVLFTGVSLTASIIFWVFFPMKFQADMALLLVLLLGFHLMGALMFIPPMVSLFRPRFAIKYAEARIECGSEWKLFASSEGSRIEQSIMRVYPLFKATAVDSASGDFDSVRSEVPPMQAGWEYVTGSQPTPTACGFRSRN